jgi:hypothetical protein
LSWRVIFAASRTLESGYEDNPLTEISLPLSNALNFWVAGRGGLSQALQNPEQYPPPLPLAAAQKISSLLVLKYSLYREYFIQTYYGNHLHP